ncbi:AraC family transcriptional regulator [Paenibacillus psychroresistens]|uniref:AraC family transcriptional regulator n=1 Tax=Paenibacillus psychroresistens TaxID=1778678 RepID=A0A6B8RKS4_9BACL|nr:AraC family transcriptional regulator [Paenibacillus psychroresistens]QGQ96447.1 AraC family transcriptional regulator [Paenibacillus psychroresistens]
MKRPSETLRGADYFPASSPIFITRSIEHFEYPYHAHDFIEFAFVAEGRGFHHMEDQVQPVRSGQLFIIPIGVSHVFRPSTTGDHKDKLVVYNCLFSPLILQALQAIIVENDIQSFVDTLVQDAISSISVLDAKGNISKLFTALYQEFSLVRNGSYSCLNSLLLQLIIEIYRCTLPDPDSNNEHKQQTTFIHTLEHIEHNYAEMISLQQLAAITGWSERQLQRLFHKHTGQSFRSYLQEQRIRKSCEMLRDSQDKISIVAENVGYKDMNSFLAVFRRIMGTSPGAYRKDGLLDK